MNRVHFSRKAFHFYQVSVLFRSLWSFLSLILNIMKRWGSSPPRGSFSTARLAQVRALCAGRFPGTELVP